MSRESVEKLIDRWINEPEFREALRKDAVGAVKKTGMELNEEEWAALKSIDWSITDEELQARTSKAL